jgi:type I restriction enzyme, S subunit
MTTEKLWNLPSSWIWSDLSNLGDIVGGGTPSTKEPKYWGSDINWISPADLTGYGAKTIVRGAKSLTKVGLDNSSAIVMPPGSVHFSSRAPIGYVVISATPMATNQGFKSLVPKSDVFNEYVYYYLKSAKNIATERASGTTFLEISGKAFGALPIPVAPYREQRRIVAKIEELFSELDKGVEAMSTAREQLKVFRQSILKHAFEGKLTEEWRNRNLRKVQTPSEQLASIHADAQERFTQAIREWESHGRKGTRPTIPTSLEELELPDFRTLPTLPQGWSYLPFGALAYSIRNGISKKPNETGMLRIFRISAVRPMAFDMSDFRHIDDNPEYRGYRLKRGDVVFTRYNGSRAYVGVAAEFRSEEEFVYPDKLIRCDVQSRFIDPGYIEKSVNCGASRAFIESRIRTTAGQAGISGADLKVMPVAVCSIGEQREINQLLEVHLSCITQLEAEIESRLAQAEALRQSIFKRAFSGRLVAHDPADEPASELVKRILAERDKARANKPERKKKKIRKQKETAA